MSTVKASQLLPTLRHAVPFWINGQQRLAAQSFPVRNVITEKPIYACSSASVKDADEALFAATRAFTEWSQTKPRARRDILLRAADLFISRQDDLEDTMRQEIGSSPEFSRFNTATAAEMLRDAAGRLAQTMTGQIPQPQEVGQSALLYKVPYGVVLGIAPWNAPYLLGLRAALYPIAAGNSCILKGAETSPGCFNHIGQIFYDAGLPDGVLNILYTTRENSATLTNHLINAPPIRKVNFTGSSAVGSLIAAEAARALKPSLLELGGKASSIVLEDAEISLAAKECARGAFVNSGQACMSTERILVSRKILEPFCEALLEQVEQLRSEIGHGCILVQESAVDRNRRLAKDAIEKGAKLLVGGPAALEYLPGSGEESHLRLSPTVLLNADKTMDIFYEESFGPTVSIYPVESEEDAIEIANDTEYGLSSSIFTRDLAKGLRLARQIDTGAVHINSMSVHDEAALAHGGQKSSGYGRFNAEWGLEEFLQPKVVTYMD